MLGTHVVSSFTYCGTLYAHHVFPHYNEMIDSPGHDCSLHVSVSLDGQGVPPYCPCRVMIGERVIVPPPQDLLHSENSPHSKSQSTSEETSHQY